MRIGINGFGRIGRNFTKALLERHPGVEIVAVNDLTSAAECAHLFKYDSNYGTFPGDVATTSDGIAIDGKTIKVLAERDPGKLPWKDLGVDVVIESTGLFTDAAKARAHIDGGGAKKVIISAPAKGEDITIVLGVNDDDLRSREAPHHLERVVHDELPRDRGQADRRRTRLGEGASCRRFTPIRTTRTFSMRRTKIYAARATPRRTSCRHRPGAAKALYLTIPEVEGTFDGFALRVPTPTVSMIYLVARRQERDDQRRTQRDSARATEAAAQRHRAVHRRRTRLERFQRQFV